MNLVFGSEVALLGFGEFMWNSRNSVAMSSHLWFSGSV
jgi:hypothetical protein